MDYQSRMEDESIEKKFSRSDRFVEGNDGFYIKTREGLDGPHPSLAAALTGLMSFAQSKGMSKFQTRKLYESICEKALSSVN